MILPYGTFLWCAVRALATTTSGHTAWRQFLHVENQSVTRPVRDRHVTLPQGEGLPEVPVHPKGMSLQV
jgi:hypothetical protein